MLNKTESGCWLSEAEQYYAVGRIYVCVNLCVCIYTHAHVCGKVSFLTYRIAVKASLCGGAAGPEGERATG